MPDRLNDGSSRPPRLRPTHAMWGLIGLPRGGPEWSLEEKFRRAAEAGFEAVECWPDETNEAEIRRALDASGMRLGYGARGGDIDVLRRKVAHARQMGADYANCHAESPYDTDDPAIINGSCFFRNKSRYGLPGADTALRQHIRRYHYPPEHQSV